MFSRQRIQPGSPYLTDESKLTGESRNVALPFSEDEVREIMRVYNSKGNPVTVSAMRTGVCGGCVPMGNDVVSLENMSGAVGVGRDDRSYFIRLLPCTTLEELDRILLERSFDGLEDLTPGAVESLSSEPVSYFYPVDPTEMGGSIGGNVATNASGPRTYRYGTTRDWVRSIRVVFADGGVTEIRRGECVAEGNRIGFPAGRCYYSFDVPSYHVDGRVKNATGPRFQEGMDLIDLFIGSEGIFGIITMVEVYLIPRVPTVSCIQFFPDDASALGAAKRIRSEVAGLEFLEFMDKGSIDLIRSVMDRDPLVVGSPVPPEGSALFFDIPEEGHLDTLGTIGEIVRSYGSSLEDSWFGSTLEDFRRMRELRHAVPKSIFEYVASLKSAMPKIHKLGTDMAVPDGAADEMMSFYRSRLDEAGLEYVIFGHIGNNHPHVEIILRSMEEYEKAKAIYEEFAAKAVSLGGSCSAEHGLGRIKTRYLPLSYGEEAVAAIRTIKDVMDPKGILNPGVILEAVR
ncbi:MAG: FAD-binding oxidoreductase [Candidatus Methanomethylophilaceae archaeon]|nr:FAD-binding oxidoreductase [Candidatus Methanomethylophilaceae archaeon]